MISVGWSHLREATRRTPNCARGDTSPQALSSMKRRRIRPTGLTNPRNEASPHRVPRCTFARLPVESAWRSGPIACACSTSPAPSER